VLSILAVETKPYRWFLREWAPEMRLHLRVLRYDRPWPLGLPRRGPCIFSDLERLSPTLKRRASAAFRRCAEHPESGPVLNDPDLCPGRYGLLKRLHREGVNPFDVHWLTDALAQAESLRSPVFLRAASDHAGPRTALLDDADAFRHAAATLRSEPKSPPVADTLVVEFCDTRGPDGLLRKYSVFRLGDRLFPRHLFFSRSWSVKQADVQTPACNEEERAFLLSDAHVAEARRVFDLVGVDYGRIDFGLIAGRMVVWGISANPDRRRRSKKTHPERVALQMHCAKQMAEGFHRLLEHRSGSVVGAPGRDAAPA